MGRMDVVIKYGGNGKDGVTTDGGIEVCPLLLRGAMGLFLYPSVGYVFLTSLKSRSNLCV